MVKLACMTLPYAKFPFERALEGISRAGFKYVAFGLAHAGVDYPDENDEHTVEKLKALFAKYDLQPTMLIANAQFKPDQPIERARKRLQTAKALGITEVLTVGTQGYRKFPTELFTEEEAAPVNHIFAEHYKKIADEAALLDLIVTIKPHTGNTATAADIMKTLKQIGKPNVWGSYDPGNVQYYEGVVAGTDFPQMAERTYSIVAKDHRGAQANLDFPVPGTGDVDFPRIFASLKTAGFDGNVVVERVDGPAELELIDQRMTESRIQLERLLTEAGFEVS